MEIITKVYDESRSPRQKNSYNGFLLGNVIKYTGCYL